MNYRETEPDINPDEQPLQPEQAGDQNQEQAAHEQPAPGERDRALDAIPEAERKGNRWVEGVELIARKLHNVLEQEGVEPIEPLGQPFDPNLHEAVAFEDNSEGGDHVDTVSEVFSKGYRLHDRIIRPAMVKVSRG